MNFESILNLKFAYLVVSPIIILFTIVSAFVFRRIFKKFMERSSEDLNADITNYKFISHSISAIIYILGFGIAIYFVPFLRSLANSLLAGAGIVTVAVGFASQQALSNIISGVFIILFKPYRVNDRLIVQSTLSGIVEDISLRHTVIRDFENNRIIIPNSVMSNEVVINSNFEDEKVCRKINIGIGYGADIREAKRVMLDEVLKHPNVIDNRSDQDKIDGVDKVVIRVIALGDSSITLRALVWAANAKDGYSMECDLLEAIKLRFDQENIEIPYPYFNIINNSLESKNN